LNLFKKNGAVFGYDVYFQVENKSEYSGVGFILKYICEKEDDTDVNTFSKIVDLDRRIWFVAQR
jgi:hypothetical protein